MTSTDNILPQNVFFSLSESGNSPWEIGRPQPVIIRLVEQNIFHGNVLDIGCGIADNAIYIVKHTNNVHLTAIDLVPKTIEVAREKAKENKVNIQFEVVNMLDDLSTTNILEQHSYDIILDAAVFHFFSNEDRQQYIKNLKYLIKPDGLYIQVSVSDKAPHVVGPRRIKKSELDELFSSTNGWTIESIEDVVYEFKSNAPSGLDGRAYLSLIRRNDKT